MEEWGTVSTKQEPFVFFKYHIYASNRFLMVSGKDLNDNDEWIQPEIDYYIVGDLQCSFPYSNGWPTVELLILYAAEETEHMTQLNTLKSNAKLRLPAEDKSEEWYETMYKRVSWHLNMTYLATDIIDLEGE